LGAIQTGWFYNESLTAAVMFWYQRRDHRGGAGGLKLFRAFEDWAGQIGAKRLSVGHLARLKPEKFEKFYRRRGYELNEVNWFKSIP
jgi:GNAT superfamily N-acetyltransferase